jgi:hypothetical protein
MEKRSEVEVQSYQARVSKLQSELDQGVGRARYQNPNFGNAVTKLQFLKKKFCKKE